MANLIITVIAIALVAVASLMGAYYGGSAFLNNQSAANASTVLNQGQQLTGAWNAYLGDNLNTPPTDLAILTTNNYLQSLPEAPAAPGSIAAALFYVTKNANGHYYAYADMGAPSTAGSPSVTDTNATACVRIAKTATGTTPPNMTAAAIGSISAAGSYGNGTFGCTASGAAPSGGLTGSGKVPNKGDYTMEYKIQ